MRTTFQPKLVGDTRTLVFDFLSALGASETVSSGTVTATVWSGVDASPSNVISGPGTPSGSQLSQNVTAGVAGVIYNLSCSVQTSLGQTLVMVGLLAVETSAL